MYENVKNVGNVIFIKIFSRHIVFFVIIEERLCSADIYCACLFM